MNILVVGSGGREHAIVEALGASRGIRRIYAAPGNGGMRQSADVVPIAADDIDGLLALAIEKRADLTFVGPEVPLSKGIVDRFRRRGMPIIGPTADNARLESSKSFAKRFFAANGIPTAAFQECSSASQALEVLDSSRFPVVIKADGLAAGKGVTVAGDLEEARGVIRSVMEHRSLGDAGSIVVIEEYLEGEEASVHVFADAPAFQTMVVAQDHKRRFDGDAGPNTGGMGAYSVDYIMSANTKTQVVEQILRPTLNAAPSYGGILYAGLMLTNDGPKVIEYNVRFGDPETQVILPRLKTDLCDVLVDMAEHRLAARTLEWSSDATAAVTLVADTYPGKVESGKRIAGLDDAARVPNVTIYHAGTRFEDGRYYTAGGRVLNVMARGVSLAAALDSAYAAAEMINFEGQDYRKDIGRKGLSKNKT
jgi:phosphoribosylamine---glycine ligase